MLVARGEDLAILLELANLTGGEDVLDVGAASGTAALALAPGARSVTGVDVVRSLLDQAAAQAGVLGLSNLRFQLGDAAALPFSNGSFDLVVSRMAGHHFPDAAAFCREAARVLRNGGRVLVVDNVAPEDPVLDSFINNLERLRDPSHVRAHHRSEWERYLTTAGCRILAVRQFRTPEPLPDWMDRLGVPPAVNAEIRHSLAMAPPEARAAFAVTDACFCLHRAAIVGVK